MKTIILVVVLVQIVRSAIVCDTEYKCKEKVALNRMKCCKVCPNAIHTKNEKKSYGFYEYLEKDPNGMSSVGEVTDRAVQDFRKKQKLKYEALKAQNPKLNPSLKKELTMCRASGSSCCRWCPDMICPRLEMTKVFIEELYWSLCSGADESHRRQVQAQLVENSMMNKLVEDGMFWDPRT